MNALLPTFIVKGQKNIQNKPQNNNFLEYLKNTDSRFNFCMSFFLKGFRPEITKSPT
ncbi:MAG: hypothetical protein HRU38_15190 [Saccharospirillaceae bacterium]|nr:hypothetical protein [Saccharospirillaceae bacterium]